MKFKRYFTILVLMSSGVAWGKTVTPVPNIVLLSIDTLRRDHLPFYGYDKNTAPNLSAFSKDAIVFENAYAPAPYTIASHMTMMTGLYPRKHLLTDSTLRNVLKDDISTLAELFTQNGYSTVWVTQTYNEQLPLNRGFSRGFKHFINGSFDENVKTFSKWVSANQEKPFFSFLHTSLPHSPYLPPVDNLDQLKVEKDAVFRKNYVALRAEVLGLSDDGDTEKTFWKHFDIKSSKDVSHLKNLYDGDILSADRAVGALISSLKKIGKYENTIIIVVSDHGESFGEHGEFQHRTLFNENLRIPMLLRLPSNKHMTVKQMVGLIDIFPTLLSLAKIDFKNSIDGIDLNPIIADTNSIQKRHFFAEFFGSYAAWNENWKLIVGTNGNRELYSMTTDIDEKNPIEKKEVQAGLNHLIESYKHP